MKEKFEGEAVEQARVKLREEKVYEEAARCPDCAVARQEAGDETALCRRHLEAVIGM